MRKQRRKPQASSAKTGSSTRRRTRPARKIEFDEEADYPEDVDLIPAGGWKKEADSAAAETAGKAAEEAVEAAAPKKAAAQKAPRRQPVEETVDDDDEEFFADDDDDMEYSFLNSSSRRGSRK